MLDVDGLPAVRQSQRGVPPGDDAVGCSVIGIPAVAQGSGVIAGEVVAVVAVAALGRHHNPGQAQRRRRRFDRCGRLMRRGRGRGGRNRRSRHGPRLERTNGERSRDQPPALAATCREEPRARQEAVAPPLACALLQRELDAPVVVAHRGDADLGAAVLRESNAGHEDDARAEQHGGDRAEQEQQPASSVPVTNHASRRRPARNRASRRGHARGRAGGGASHG